MRELKNPPQPDLWLSEDFFKYFFRIPEAGIWQPVP